MRHKSSVTVDHTIARMLEGGGFGRAVDSSRFLGTAGVR